MPFRLIILSTWLLFSFTAHAQKMQYDVGDLTFEQFVTEAYYERFTSAEELPDSTITLITNQLKTKIGNNFNNITLKYFDIIEVKKFLHDFPDSLNQYFLPIPRYRAVFNWCDSTLGIKSYLFQVLTDQYCQFVYLGFPRIVNTEYDDFMTCDRAHEMADSITVSSATAYEKKSTYLYYDNLVNDLKWVITYSKDNYRKEGEKSFSLFRILTFSLKNHKLLSDVTEESDFIYFQF
jgi:hypothetical protein